MIKTISWILLVIMPCTVLAQMRFARVYGAGERDVAQSLIQTNDAGFLIAGNTSSFGSLSDILVVKTDSTGLLEWARVIGGTGVDLVSTVIETADLGYLIAGTSTSFSADSDAVVIKLDVSGNYQWSRIIGETGLDQAYSAIEVADGYIVAGVSQGFDATYDMVLTKLDNTGAYQWCKRIDADDEYGKSLIRTVDRGYALAGHTTAGQGGFDFAIVSFDSLWNSAWAKTIGSTGAEDFSTLVQSPDAGFVLAGHSLALGTSSWDYFITKLNAAGVHVWSRAIGGGSYERCFCMTGTDAGGIVMTGYSFSYAPGAAAFFLVMLDSLGTHEWSNALGGPDYERSYAVVATRDHGYAVAGYTYSYAVADIDMLLAKYNQAGLSCVGAHVTPDVYDVMPTVSDFACSVSDVTYSVVDTTIGLSAVALDTATVCFATMIRERSQSSPSCLHVQAPLFFTDRIELQITTECPSLELALFDITGTLITRTTHAGGPRQVTVTGSDITDLTAGIYFLVTQTPGDVYYNKMIKVTD